ncbi:MAG: hybrid sensor histidine kinase/response regulator [Sphaerospermopsis sp. SIO1G2]|nr:hybrid sensor histidine kinase/response regulator [Sphaerospermopsis sp. SIO1G2]
MMATTCLLKILLIEDNLAEARLLQEFLKQAQIHDFILFHVQRLKDGINEINQHKYDVILLDLTLPDSQGLSSLTLLMNNSPSTPIVVLTNINDEELAVEAVKQGAQDYLVKRQVNPSLLLRSVQYAIARKQVLEKLVQVNQTLENRVEERTAELEKAQQLYQFKSEFVSMLSHDIRNPLNTILLAAGLLQNNDEKLTKEKKINHLNMIRSAIKNMAQLLDEVSFIGKADSGKLQSQLNLLDLECFCHQILEDIHLTALEKKVTIEFNICGDFEQSLWDEKLLRHILENLLGNAIKYSTPHSQVNFTLIQHKKTVVFKIQDWGIGISAADQQQLFTPFYRGENVHNIYGTGMGLAIVKKCVDTLDGKILVDSKINSGTTFTVILPLITTP